MKDFGQHPALDALELHLLQRLDTEEEAETVAHLLVCRACRKMTEALQVQIDLIRTALHAC